LMSFARHTDPAKHSTNAKLAIFGFIESPV